MNLKFQLKAGVVLPLLVGAAGLSAAVSSAQAGQYENPAAIPAGGVKADCNPCAAKQCNPCNPCAAKNCNPCNPCAAESCSPCAAESCNPCAAKQCNPCAAKACNPSAAESCNPCAAQSCNPCAAKNPCNPCAAKSCNPCNPCAAASGASVSDDEAAAAYRKALSSEGPVYGNFSGYVDWQSFNTAPYPSATHGGRLVNNYVNDTGAEAYGMFEDISTAPEGTVVAKDSITIGDEGKAEFGPLFLMEKMAAGFAPDQGDWKYTLVMPGGGIFGATGGANSSKVQFCADCHRSAEANDHLFFVPEEVRKSD